MMIWRNCSGVAKRFWVMICAVNSAVRVNGCAPIEPPATWLFCSCTAASASEADRLYPASFCGSSQMRMA